MQQPVSACLMLYELHRKALWSLQAQAGRASASSVLRELIRKATPATLKAMQQHFAQQPPTAENSVRPWRQGIALEARDLDKLDQLVSNAKARSRSAAVRFLIIHAASASSLGLAQLESEPVPPVRERRFRFEGSVASHVVLPSMEQLWRERYCKPRRCYHSLQATWLCVERFLANQPGSTRLESLRLSPAGPRLRKFAVLTKHPNLTAEEAAAAVDGSYRRFIRNNARPILCRGRIV